MFFGGSHFVGFCLSHPRVGSVLQALGDKHQGKVCFFIGEGGGGASEGRVLSKFFTNWGGSNLFYSPKDDISDIVHDRKHLITNSPFDGHPVR